MAKGKYEDWLSEEGLLLIEGWARDGLTYEQIASNMGISASTLREWKKTYSAISAALKKGRKVVIRELENALVKRAKGDETEEEIYERDKDGEVILSRKVKKVVPPDTTALIFALKNMDSANWRDKKEMELSGNVGIADELAAAWGRVKNSDKE
ncbi:helix-turn-helix domain-containing protein [Anaerovibrio sp. RM50]|uniref:helix-turn-helix domain-containing protein n=1 Tax=Anaerovibrio sp. RM50 TaxID=1200557 RepID=UPI0004808EC9|nr:helix-turn-helix domain-containing protein [Anaerovibrio sp. RM50]